MMKCEYCGSGFEMSSRIVNQRFCSAPCRRRARADREGVGIGSTEERKCLECGSLMASTLRRGRMYCSLSCKNAGSYKKVAPCFLGYSLFIKDGYACLSYRRGPIPLHRIIYLLLEGRLSTKDNPIDHINQNKLDNRIENLRLASRSKNAANKKVRPNKSGYRGVYPSKDKWIAQISIEGKVKALGRFSSKEDAALAYNRAALQLWGADAEVNKVG